MSKSFGQQLMIVNNRTTLEEMILGVLQGIMRSRNLMWHILLVLQRIVLESFKALLFFRGQTCLLLLPDLLCGDFREFIRTSFPDEDSHFIVCWPAAID